MKMIVSSMLLIIGVVFMVCAIVTSTSVSATPIINFSRLPVFNTASANCSCNLSAINETDPYPVFQNQHINTTDNVTFKSVKTQKLNVTAPLNYSNRNYAQFTNQTIYINGCDPFNDGGCDNNDGIVLLAGYNVPSNEQFWIGTKNGLNDTSAGFMRYGFYFGIPWQSGVNGRGTANLDSSINPFTKTFFGSLQDDGSNARIQSSQIVGGSCYSCSASAGRSHTSSFLGGIYINPFGNLDISNITVSDTLLVTNGYCSGSPSAQCEDLSQDQCGLFPDNDPYYYCFWDATIGTCTSDGGIYDCSILNRDQCILAGCTFTPTQANEYVNGNLTVRQVKLIARS